MATTCELTGKGNQYGKRVSHSKRRTNHVWRANIQKKTFVLDGQKVTMHLSTQAIRTLRKKGILGGATAPASKVLTEEKQEATV